MLAFSNADVNAVACFDSQSFWCCCVLFVLSSIMAQRKYHFQPWNYKWNYNTNRNNVKENSFINVY